MRMWDVMRMQDKLVTGCTEWMLWGQDMNWDMRQNDHKSVWRSGIQTMMSGWWWVNPWSARFGGRVNVRRTCLAVAKTRFGMTVTGMYVHVLCCILFLSYSRNPNWLCEGYIPTTLTYPINRELEAAISFVLAKNCTGLCRMVYCSDLVIYSCISFYVSSWSSVYTYRTIYKEWVI